MSPKPTSPSLGTPTPSIPPFDYSTETPTLVEFRLEPVPNGTRLTVTETGFQDLPPHRLSDAFRMNSNGWEQQMKNIEAYVTKA